jgi:hypothetical protein
MKNPPESINSELFNSFNPEEELWVVGGSKSVSSSSEITASPDTTDINPDVRIDWVYDEEPDPPAN